jgi:hypothetical protein
MPRVVGLCTVAVRLLEGSCCSMYCRMMLMGAPPQESSPALPSS